MCGVFGIHGHPEAANLAYLGLHSLQHRGQESAGVVTCEDSTLHAVRKMGHVAATFTRERLARLPGTSAVGHTRYTTAGGSLPKNIQPLTVESRSGALAIAHNGNLVNAEELREELEADGSIFSSNSDTEVILQLMARARGDDLAARLGQALTRVRGAYSLVLLSSHGIVAARDPHGFRPLVLGKVRGHENSWVVASETCAFDLIGAERVRDVAPGEILSIRADGLRSVMMRRGDPRYCVFEHVYFARPDSRIDDLGVYNRRVAMGRRLAVEHPAEADLVIPVPDSGMVAALGYSKQSGLPFEIGLSRNHYVGRTFIEPKDSIRHFGVKLKLNAVPDVLRGKRVVVVDDSVVRGTTSRKIVKLVRDAGARAVHVRISSPPVTHPCYYGINTPTRDELIGSKHDVEETRRFITADSLGYLSPEGLLEAASHSDSRQYCTACFTGDYPVPIERASVRHQLRLIEV
ncbi:MAG: amidophosphoribosyltransferase [Myxococcales bacterium FL481]|nr:MAG: amidophosphoribosyltransferase [Myxococcales bacterium FL481]